MTLARETPGTIISLPVSPTHTAMDEKALVEACRRGERAALRRLAEEYYDRVYRVARTLENDPGEAEDLTQDAFAAALKAIRRFRGESGLFTWLVSILRNRWLNRRRKAGRIAPMTGRASVAPSEGQSDAVVDIQAAFGELEPEDRAILELYHYEELKYEEIREVLDIPLGTVKSRLFNARQKLKSFLEGSHAV